MKLKLTAIGFVLTLISAIILNVFPPLMPLGAALIFIGVILFVGMYNERSFIDFITFEDENYIISVRKRHYYNFLPFTVIFSIFRFDINFIYKVEYYKVVVPNLELLEKNLEQTKVNRAEYKQLLIHQRQQYKNNLVPKEIVADVCSPDVICFKQRKSKYILSLVLTILSALMLLEPDPAAILLAVLFGGLFGWLLIIRKAEYEEAKIKKATYDRYFPQ